MAREHPSLLLGFPGSCYFPEWDLMTWRPSGILDEKLVDAVLDFTEVQEHLHDERPFNRFTDLSELTRIQLPIGHIFKVGERRRAKTRGRPIVKSAFFCDKTVGFGIAKIYESILTGSTIWAQAFREREAAAEWLAVPIEVVSP